MKTTLDIPDEIFRQTKARAALRGVSLRRFITEALEEKVSPSATVRPDIAEPPWMRGFGALADLRDETRRIEAEIEQTFGVLDSEDRT